MESTLDIKPRLELLAFLGIINVIDELVDPVFDRTVHLIVSGIALLEGNRRFTGCIHEILTTSSAFTERAAPLGARKNTAVLIEIRGEYLRLKPQDESDNTLHEPRSIAFVSF